MLVDTHCHLYHGRFDGDRDDVIERARAAGVTRMLLPAIDVASIRAALALCERHEGLYAMAALHPSETLHATEADFEAVTALSDDGRVVAVGETGLDYYWDRSFDARQHDALRRHARLAMDKDLPLVLHNRDRQGAVTSSNDLVRVLTEERDISPFGTRLRGVFHCFGGVPSFAQAVLNLGFHVGLGGTLTYKNSGVARAIADVPLERIVLETDAPFLAPNPFRGERNEPAHVRLVAEALAAIRGVPFDEIVRVTTANAVKLFGLPT